VLPGGGKQREPYFLSCHQDISPLRVAPLEIPARPCGLCALRSRVCAALLLAESPGVLPRKAFLRHHRTIALGPSSSRACPSSIRFVNADGNAESVLVTNGHSPAWGT